MATKRGSSDPSRNYKRQKLDDEDLAEGCEKILDAPAFMNHLLLEILFANPDTRTHSNQVAKTFVRKFNTNILDEYYQTYGRQVFVILDDAFLITHHFTNIERKVLLQLVIRFIVSTIESEVMAGQDINVMCDRVYRILTTKHNELYDLRVSLLEHVESLYDKNEVLGLRILEALLDICSLNSQASFNTIYKALQQLPSLCSSFYPELGPKKQTICRIVLFYFQKFVDGQLADSIVVEFVKLWNLIARAEYQYSKLNSGVMLNFVNEMGNEVTNYLLQFLVRPYLDKAFRNAVIEALCVMNKVHQIEDVVIPFILQNIEKQSERKEIAIRLAHSMISDDLLARNAENLPHFMQLLLNLLSDPSRRVRGQAFKVASLVFQLKCKVFETNKSLTISFMSEILNACQQGTPNSFKALAAFPISWFANLEGFESHSIIRLMLKNLLIGNVVNKTTESTKFKKRLTSICDAISSWSIHFPEILDEVIDSIISVLYKIIQFPVPLLRTTVVPLKHQCMLYIATREQDLGSQFSVIPIDLMNELLNYKEIDDDIRFYYEKSLVSTISNILQNAATYEIQIHEIDRLWPKLKQISSSPRSEVNMEALRLAALLSSRWKSDKLAKYADECNTLLQSCKE